MVVNYAVGLINIFMSRFKKILIFLLFIAIILTLVFWYLSTKKSKTNKVIINQDKSSQSQDVKNNLKSSENKTIPPVSKKTKQIISEKERLEAQLKKITNSFVERYGSYSNQTNFENLTDLKFFMTNALKVWIDGYINSQKTRDKRKIIYYGITTKVLNIKIIKFDTRENQVKFLISTQRHEIVGSMVNDKVYYQNVELEMKKESGVWKVNKVEWK